MKYIAVSLSRWGDTKRKHCVATNELRLSEVVMDMKQIFINDWIHWFENISIPCALHSNNKQQFLDPLVKI